MPIISESDRLQIVQLQSNLDSIRNRLNISSPEDVLFFGSLSYGDDEFVVVEADGLGGATAMVIEGAYPLNVLVKHSRFFATEDEAMRSAERILHHREEPQIILGD